MYVSKIVKFAMYCELIRDVVFLCFLMISCSHFGASTSLSEDDLNAPRNYVLYLKNETGRNGEDTATVEVNDTTTGYRPKYRFQDSGQQTRFSNQHAESAVTDVSYAGDVGYVTTKRTALIDSSSFHTVESDQTKSSDGPFRANRSVWDVTQIHNKNFKSNYSASRHPRSATGTKAPFRVFNPQKRSVDFDPLYHSDSPGFEERGTPGKMYGPQRGSGFHITAAWQAMRPLVLCLGNVMTLKAQGRGYAHLVVDRGDALPVSLFHVPPHCGYTVKATWRDLVLSAPYDGCYVTQENGSYVLSLLWWGIPVKLSCPMSTKPRYVGTEVFCSATGMAVKIDGAQDAMETFGARVKDSWMPLVSQTCAHHVDFPSKELVLVAPYNAPCVTVKDGVSTLVVQLEGKEFTLSCRLPVHFYPYGPSLPYPHSPQPQSPIAPTPVPTPVATPKPSLVPRPPSFQQVLIPLVRPQPPTHPYIKPLAQYPESVVPTPLSLSPYILYPYMLPQTQPPMSGGPPGTPAPPLHQYSVPAVYYLVKQPPPPATGTAHPTTTATTSTTTTARGPTLTAPPSVQYPVNSLSAMPTAHHPTHLQSPVTCPPYAQTVCAVYHPHRLLSTTASPSSTSQSRITPTVKGSDDVPAPLPVSLSCSVDGLVVSLPVANMDIFDLKIKDIRRSTWVSYANIPVDCDYKVRLDGQSDVRLIFSAPLPACHSHVLPSSMHSLTLRFWDMKSERNRTFELECPYVPPRITTGAPPTPISISTIHSQKPVTLPPHAISQLHAPPKVLCTSEHMNVALPPGSVTKLVVQDIDGRFVRLMDSPGYCGYLHSRGTSGDIIVTLPFDSCHMARKDDRYTVMLKYQTLDGKTAAAQLFCPVPAVQAGCDLPRAHRLPCGSGHASAVQCLSLGCCFCPETSTCYYPMDECTADHHFVFSVSASLTDPPLSLAHLTAGGNKSCTPQKVVSNLALFKIPLNECGTHRYEVGKTVIYMVEILNRIKSITLNYGTITRDSPVRLVVECRYLPGSVVSAGFMVKSPSLGPSIQAQGVFGVQLRIAKDKHYTDYHPQYHQPLHVLLGKPLYLEVRLLNPPDLSVKLLVHYCVAYPRSAQSAWVVIYDGCPNPLDPVPSHDPPAPPPSALSKHVKRFTVSTFQFLKDGGHKRPDDEIYFMCSTEVCLPSDGQCVDGCFHTPGIKDD